MNGLCTHYQGKVLDHTWEVAGLGDCADGNLTLTLEGSDYTLEQFHLHTPSEHTVGGKYFDAEVHFVFNIGSKYSVIGIMLEATRSEANTFLANFWGNFDNAEHEMESGMNWLSYFPGEYAAGGNYSAASYFSYDGSFTTPPCTEGVKWYIFSEPLHMSVQQLNEFKKAVAGLPKTFASLSNERPIQDNFNRTVKMHLKD